MGIISKNLITGWQNYWTCRSSVVELAMYNISANAIRSGHILTPLSGVTWEHPARSVWLRDCIAMRRPGRQDVIVSMCIMLAYDTFNYIIGQAYHMDGGCLVSWYLRDIDNKYK